MQRVHANVLSAADVLYVDATGNLDRGCYHLLNLVIWAPLGGMLVGSLAVEREDAPSFEAALRLYVGLAGHHQTHAYLCFTDLGKSV